MRSKNNWSRRNFIQMTSGGVPTLALMLQQTSAALASPVKKRDEAVSNKFTPIDLSRYFTATPSDFGPRERAKGLSRDDREDGLIHLPTGKHMFRGIPFLLGPEDAQKKSWIALSSQATSWVTRSLEIPLRQKANFVCLAQFCDWDQNERPAPGRDVLERVGQVLELSETYEIRSEEHTSELQSRPHLVCRLLLEKKKISIYSPPR